MTCLKTFYSSSNPFERRFGYARAVRRGPFIFVSGTTALKTQAEQRSEGGRSGSKAVHFPTDAYQQAKVAFGNCVDAVEKLGGCRGDVMRVRMFVARHEDGDAVGRAFADTFKMDSAEEQNAEGISRGEVGATAIMLFGNSFVDPDILVEVEVDAICSSGGAEDVGVDRASF